MRRRRLTDIVADAAARFDSRPLERASIDARRELAASSKSQFVTERNDDPAWWQTWSEP